MDAAETEILAATA